MSSNICAILEQRRQLAQLRKPPIRYEGLQNPYTSGTITQYQLDMRRKAEILQYKKSASQTNQMTKRGRYAKLFTAGSTEICPADLALPTLSSSSDVPGPIITLQYDASIPLYNIASTADNYANLNENPDLNKQFTLYAENNVLVQNGASVTIANLVIDTPIESNTTFDISIPIGIYVSVDVSGNSVYNSTFRITSPIFGVYYNGSEVPNTATQSFTSVSTTIISNTNRTTISGVKYVGNLRISNLTLPTQAKNVYEFRMSATTELLTHISGIYIPPLVVGMFANVSNDNFVNCTITLNGTPNPPTNQGSIQISTV